MTRVFGERLKEGATQLSLNPCSLSSCTSAGKICVRVQEWWKLQSHFRQGTEIHWVFACRDCPCSGPFQSMVIASFCSEISIECLRPRSIRCDCTCPNPTWRC